MRLFKRKGDSRWRIRIKDERGRWTERVACKGKPESVAYMKRLVTEYEEAKTRKADPFAEHAAAPIQDHIDGYIGALEGRERDAHHVQNTRQRVERVVKSCGWKTIEDIDADQVARVLKKWRDNGLSIGSSNHYLRAAKSWELWLEAENRIPRRRLAHLRALKNKQPRRQRRALTDAEVARFLAATEKSTATRNGLDGPTRALIYRVSLATGLRLGEIAGLIPEDILLNRVPCPAIRVRATISKNSNETLIPLRSDVAQALRPVIANARPSHPIFPGSWRWRGAVLVRADLAEAGIDYMDDEGRVVDFHGLRHTAVTQWVRAGLSVKQCQSLARHASPVLTLNVYAHIACDELASEVEKTLPETHHNDDTRAIG